MNCEKCHQRLNTCQGCNGRPDAGGRTCSRCANTGLVCAGHGAHWRR